MPDIQDLPYFALKLEFSKDGYITRVEKLSGPLDVDVSELQPGDRKKFRRSSHGLRPLDTIYETPDPDATLGTATKCYMIIGGYKVQVPCS